MCRLCIRFIFCYVDLISQVQEVGVLERLLNSRLPRNTVRHKLHRQASSIPHSILQISASSENIPDALCENMLTHNSNTKISTHFSRARS